MPEAAIALGSNLGDRKANILNSLDRMRALGSVVAVSALRSTAPVGFVDQPDFLNGAALLQTELSPLELMHALLGIERAMGRERVGVPAKGPRLIDLDLLLYGGVTLETPELTLPHPAMHERRFVLEPLAEIAPGWVHPRAGISIAELLRRLPGV